MKNFIKATEIWIPDETYTQLTLRNGEYGEHETLESATQKMTFAYNEGLPGKVWAEGHPVILTDLKASFFQRTELALSLGLTSAIAMPIFKGEYLSAVLVFFCGDSEEHAGAIEVWRATPNRVHEMELINGYYGTMVEFEWISKRIKIMKGQGLPGTVWKREAPVIMNSLGKSESFIRAKKAAKEGLTTALGLPAGMRTKDGYVITFLTDKGTPIARQIEIWSTDENDTLKFIEGYSAAEVDLAALYEEVTFTKENSLIGQTWKQGRPLLSKNCKSDYAPENCNCILTLPILQDGFCFEIIAFYY